MDKKAIKYYASFFEVSKELNQKQFYEFNNAIFSVMFYERHINQITFDDKLLSIAWTSVKHSLQASIDGFCSKNNIDYNDTLSKGVSKGLSKGLGNNEKEKEKEKEKDKDKDKDNIEAFIPNAKSIDAVNAIDSNCDINSLVDDFKDQARNRAKPFKDLQSGFRHYIRKGWIKPVKAKRIGDDMSYREIINGLKKQKDGKVLDLKNKMRAR